MTAIDPLFDALRDIGWLKPRIEGSVKQRILWLGTGVMASMPFHAAGIYDGDAGIVQTTGNFVMSTYITSLKSLMHARSTLVTADHVADLPSAFFRHAKHSRNGKYQRRPRVRSGESRLLPT